MVSSTFLILCKLNKLLAGHKHSESTVEPPSGVKYHGMLLDLKIEKKNLTGIFTLLKVNETAALVSVLKENPQNRGSNTPKGSGLQKEIELPSSVSKIAAVTNIPNISQVFFFVLFLFRNQFKKG